MILYLIQKLNDNIKKLKLIIPTNNEFIIKLNDENILNFRRDLKIVFLKLYNIYNENNLINIKTFIIIMV